jgi:hypothetical protein
MTTPEVPDDLITVREAVALLKSPWKGKETINKQTLYRWIWQGKLPSWRRGSYIFVSRRDVEALTQLQPTQVQAPPSQTPRQHDREVQRRLRAAGLK